MPFYPELRIRSNDSQAVKTAKQRACERLLALKQTFAADALPERNLDGSLLLATWNIREFGAAKMGPRLMESIYYLAEIINCFDFVALQEVRRDLAEFDHLRRVLGRWWKVLFTDVTEGGQGNSERTAFLYDARKIEFGGLAGEVVLPPKKEGKKTTPVLQIARTPYLAGFQAGWFKFTICTTHLYYGQSKADDPQRLAETEALAGFLAKEVKRAEAWARNMVLLGDFNIFSTKDKQFEALKEAGFKVPQTLFDTKTNAIGNKPFDQIAFIAPSLTDKLDESKSGVVPVFDQVFKDEDESLYAAHMGPGYLKDAKGKVRDAKSKTSYYRKWRTFQMSDHNPLWVELKTDYSARYLQSLVKA
jgi:endonuclease/exonuclease/phosphatase family metal-dependent hydrolase